MATFILDYDILDVSCDRCENWVQLSGADPRRRAEGYGFRFNGMTPPADFTALHPPRCRMRLITRWKNWVG